MNNSVPHSQPLTTGLRLKQLQLFAAVAETLSFSRAAAILYVSQPLISQQISDLEHQVGTKLFLRNRHSVQLTPAGEIMLQEASSILQRASNAVKLIRELDDTNYFDSDLNIGFEPMYRRQSVTRTVLRFKMQYPNTACTLSCGSVNQILSQLADGELSVGFILLPPDSMGEEWIVEELEDDQLCIVAAKQLATQNTLEYFLGLAECLPICLLDKDSRGLNTTLSLCSDLGIAPHIQFYDNINDILLQTEAGSGVSILPSNVVRGYASPDLVWQVPDMQSTRIRLAACWHKNQGEPVVPLFLELYRQINELI